jgi:hypothetical protein
VKRLTREDVYNAWVSSMSMCGSLFKSIVKELGMAKALEMLAKQGEPFGDELGKVLKTQLGGKKLDVKALNKAMMPMMSSSGVDAEVEENPKSLVLKISKCPQYDGFKMAGLDHETIGKMCSAMAKGEYASIMRHYPELEGRVKFRETPNGVCQEEFVIK